MLKGKKALITGGSRGIGRAIALAMARQGADVALIYAGNEGAAQAACEAIQAIGGKALSYRCDVANEAAVVQTLPQIIRDLGGLDILVNNAGIVKDGLLPMMKEADFTAVINTNLLGTYHMIRYTGMHFIRQRSGRIINLSSVVGLSGNAGQANYAAAKAGIIGLTKSCAKEFASRGITCNAIAPGFINTDMTDAIPEDKMKLILDAIPLKRAGQPEDVANMAVFLASDLASYITGAVFTVDGGMSI
jgi:3-oxoacyl-[acyl-carrier protein] reductase